MRSNRVPMTLQIGLRCDDGSIVLAGDTKVGFREPSGEIDRRTQMMWQSKVAHATNHGIAVAMAGEDEPGSNAARKLCAHLASQQTIPDYMEPMLNAWGSEYFRSVRPGMQTNAEEHLFSLLVVNPRSERNPFWRLFVNLQSWSVPTTDCAMNGNSDNPALFWLGYLKPEFGGFSPNNALSAATMTILGAAQFNSMGIGGLEVHQYLDGAWREWSAVEISRATGDYIKARDQIRRLALTISGPVTPPQP